MPYKIAVIAYVLGDKQSHRGAGKYFYQFFTNMIKAGCLVDVYSSIVKASDEDLEKFNLNKLVILTDEEEKSLDKKFFESKGYDFVISCGIEDYVDIVLLHPHSIIYRQEVVRTPFEKFIKRIFNAHRMVTPEKAEAFKKNLDKPDNLLANSKVAAYDYTEFCGISPDKIHILNPCVEIEKDFEYNPQDIFTFGLCGVTFSLKGGYTFLKALTVLKKAKYDFKAKIVYPNHDKNMILKFFMWFYGLNDKVTFLGYQSDMTNFYSSIDCLVVPSREETFGLVVLEAMANSKITLVSSRCGATDIIKNDENGFIFDFEKKPEKNLFDKMKFILENQKNLYSVYQNSYNTATENSLEKHGQKMVQILDKISKKKNEDFAEK